MGRHCGGFREGARAVREPARLRNTGLPSAEPSPGAGGAPRAAPGRGAFRGKVWEVELPKSGKWGLLARQKQTHAEMGSVTCPDQAGHFFRKPNTKRACESLVCSMVWLGAV